MNEFDHRPDAIVGEALREILSAPDDAAFARRVMDRVPQVIAGESWWEVLGGWARPGVAAAVAVLAGAADWMAREPRSEMAAGGGPGGAGQTVTPPNLLGAGPVH